MPIVFTLPGMTTSVTPVQASKVLSCIPVTLVPSVTSVMIARAGKPNTFAIKLGDVPKKGVFRSSLVSLQHSCKAASPMLVTLEGMLILAKVLQPWHIDEPIVLTFSPIAKACSFSHL